MWHGYRWISEDYLCGHPQLLENSSLIIASQYNGLIYTRLKEKGLKICDCYVQNNIGKTPYHNDIVIPFSDNRYSMVKEFFEDDYSRELFNTIVENRIAESKMRRPFLIPYNEKNYNEGFEDYWIRVPAARKHENAIVIDCGAYIGDTIEAICRTIGNGIIKYYAIEPNEDSYEVLSKKELTSEFYSELIAVNSGVGETNEEFYLIASDEFSDASHFTKGNKSGKKTKTITIDSMNITPDADVFIKMDIEGFEMDALRGAENTIRTLKPALAICIYHKENDVVEVPMYLKSLVPEYSIYLTGGSHTICIAQIESRQ